MSHEHIDEETLAAFLDGRLDDAERARVQRVLAHSDEMFAEFREAANVADALRAETARSAAPLRSARWRRNALIAVPVLAAAGIVGVVVTRPSRIPDAVMLAQETITLPASGAGSIERTMGVDWQHPGWTVTRGVGGGESEGTALRLGARFAQLEFAANAEDTAAWRQVAAALVSQLGAVDVAGPIVATLDTLDIPARQARASLAVQLRELSGSTFAFDLGTWMELARLNARIGRASWFAPEGSSTRLLRRLVGNASSPGLRPTIDALTPFTASEPLAGGAPAAAVRLDSAFARIPR